MNKTPRIVLNRKEYDNIPYRGARKIIEAYGEKHGAGSVKDALARLNCQGDLFRGFLPDELYEALQDWRNFGTDGLDAFTAECIWGDLMVSVASPLSVLRDTFQTESLNAFDADGYRAHAAIDLMNNAIADIVRELDRTLEALAVASNCYGHFTPFHKD